MNDTTNSPWEVQPERPRTYFAEIFGEVLEKVKGGSLYDSEVHGPRKTEDPENGINTFWEITIGTDPLESGESYTTRYFNFGHDWNKIVLPSLQALARDGKLTHPGDIYGKFARYRLEVWRDYSKSTVEHYQRENAEKLRSNDNNRLYVERKAHVFEDVYASHAEAVAASDALFGVQSSNDPFASNGDEPPTGLPPVTGQIDRNLVVTMVQSYIKSSAVTENGRVNRDAVQKFIDSNKMVADAVTLEDKDIKEFITEVEAEANKQLAETPPF